MEISKGAVLHVVEAARATAKLEETVRKLTLHGNGDNAVNPILGTLLDVLFDMTGEKTYVETDFCNTQANVLVYDDSLSDEEVADRIISLHEQNRPKMPKPNLVSRVQFQEMVRKFGGYSAGTPEGEW